MDFQEFKKKYQQIPVQEKRNSVDPEPVVSVCVQTYQHVNYIRECLEGILMQKTSFSYEILLGEDESSDGTREICLEYAQKYPYKIRLFLHHRENNIKINGNLTGRFNFTYNLFSARGKYIAICEGDDYWTDNLKLQRQINFLEENKDFGICFHRVRVFDQSQKVLIEDVLTKQVQDITDINDLARGNFIHTPSVLLRNTFSLPFWFCQTAIGDWTLYMLQIGNQKIKKLDELMAVYRFHEQGVWATKSEIERIKWTFDVIKILEKEVRWDKKTRQILKRRIKKEKDISPYPWKLIYKIKKKIFDVFLF